MEGGPLLEVVLVRVRFHVTCPDGIRPVIETCVSSAGLHSEVRGNEYLIAVLGNA
jgi:hypothetical protein